MDNPFTLTNFINGRWEELSNGHYHDTINSATGEVISRVPLSSEQTVDHAAKSARLAFPEWRKTPVTKRIKYLFELKQKLENNLEELAKTITIESGKTLPEARGELRRAIENVEVACGAPVLMQGYNNEDIASDIDEIMIRQPVGVTAVIAPFNFPAMIPFWFRPYAIAAGNTCIIKPSEKVPNTMFRIFKLLKKLGLPKGVVNMINGDKTASKALLKQPEINSISFVGSTPVAKSIYNTAAAHRKRVQASGGAKNPIIILPDADPEVTTRIVGDSAFGSAGQRCLAASLAITVGEAKQRFQDIIQEKALGLSVGNGLEEDIEMGPVISTESKSRIEQLLDQGVSEGANILVDGRNPEGSQYKKGHFIRPTVVGDLQPDNVLAKTEIFGPILSFMHVETVEDAIQLINSGTYGNMACLFTTDGAAARKFRYEVEAGNIGINIGVAAPMAFYPFGGWRESFFGDLHGQGRDAFNFFTRKIIVIERWPD